MLTRALIITDGWHNPEGVWGFFVASRLLRRRRSPSLAEITQTRYCKTGRHLLHC